MEEYLQASNKDNDNQFNNNNTPPLRERPTLTYILIALNIAVWLILIIISLFTGKPYNTLLQPYGAKVNSLILKGEFWRFFTPIFLHGSFLHLAANSYSLFYLGTQTEALFGRKKFISIYLFSGILGSIASFAFSTNPSVGASGAIFGLMGAMLYIIYRRPALLQTSLGINLLTIVGINLVIGFTSSGIDNFAHIGGLVGGFLMTGALLKINNNGKKVWLSGNRVLIIAALLSIGILIYGFITPNNRALIMIEDLRTYNREEKWSHAEKTAEEILTYNNINDNIKFEALYSLTLAEAMQEKWDESLEHAEQLTKEHEATGYYLLGIIYLELGDYSSAEEALSLSKKAGPEYVEYIDQILNEINPLIN